MPDAELVVHYVPAAIDDLEDAVLWYETKRDGLGLRFRSAVIKAEQRLAQNPGLGAPVVGRSVPRGVRRLRLKRFPYSLFYVDDGEVVVVAVAHDRRRPGYWKDRV